ncbi:hypothetical protein B4110_0593 [Parageobacillus toebii]|uniref:Uncharacterized protein n=1 Tax=Parageobacillus toebii TaxID=153151 RepID=A0A150MJW1_9BACL|nr:hypothetical protein B4110_0593 [Parageobacillus toebii]
MLADWSTGGGCTPSPRLSVLQSVRMSTKQTERERATIRKGEPRQNTCMVIAKTSAS